MSFDPDHASILAQSVLIGRMHERTKEMAGLHHLAGLLRQAVTAATELPHGDKASPAVRPKIRRGESPIVRDSKEATVRPSAAQRPDSRAFGR
jgi:hypothetical protein